MQDGHRHVVVVVEDDDAVRDSLRFLLESAGYDVATFSSATAFLTETGLRDIACMLIDQHMPHVTGLELLARIRAMSPSLPVALMTGSPSDALTSRAFELGVTKMFEKPLEEGDLLGFLQRALG